jgi:two-component system, OmpR family, KDP operon response regulator KdpE
VNKKSASILVVDDEIEIQRVLTHSLRAHGYTVLTASSGEDVLQMISHTRPDLILLDLMLPGISGLQVCQHIRAISNIPILVLSAKDSEREKVEALDLGADDYIEKPFGINEVLARIRVALRHVEQMQSDTQLPIQIGPLDVDSTLRRVRLSGHEITLTPTEYDLLTVLLLHRSKVLTRRMLLRLVWGEGTQTSTHSLHVYIAQLRRKIEPDPDHPRFIQTIPGVGYRFDAEMETPAKF